jgi:purine-nucleoside phosphorylase
VLLAKPKPSSREIKRPLHTTDGMVAAALAAIRRHWADQPQDAIILGTGLGGLADEIRSAAVIPYGDVPGFPCSTALAHKGQLVCGELAGRCVVAMQGRCHFYEGHSFEQLGFGTRVMAALGAQRLIASNAAGGLNPQFVSGDVMVIDDHINFMFQQPTGGNRAKVQHYYCRQLIEQALALARRENIVLQRGVYVGVTGPNYETRAEYRMFRRIGADAVGMSTIPEVLTAASCGMQVLGFSAITNIARPDAPREVTAQEVVDVAACAAPKIQRLLMRLLGS